MFAELNKVIYLIRGIPGSGKSTLADILKRRIPTSVTLAADDFPDRYLANGDLNPKYTHKQAHDWFKSELDRLIENEVRVIILHNTFVEMERIVPIQILAEKHGYSFQVIHCEAFFYPTGQRASSSKNVPKSVMKKMSDNWQRYGYEESDYLTP